MERQHDVSLALCTLKYWGYGAHEATKIAQKAANLGGIASNVPRISKLQTKYKWSGDQHLQFWFLPSESVHMTDHFRSFLRDLGCVICSQLYTRKKKTVFVNWWYAS